MSTISQAHPRKVLVLNKAWVAIAVVSWKRAIRMLFAGSEEHPNARIIDPTQDFQQFTWKQWEGMRPKDGEEVIKTAHDTFRMPEIILVSRYDKLPTHRVRFNRRTIFHRDNNTCQYCGKKFSASELNIDHIMPKALGGKSGWDNCVLACIKCNTKKADRTPEQANMKLLRKPFKPKYTIFKGDVRIRSWEHFLGEAYWNTDLAG